MSLRYGKEIPWRRTVSEWCTIRRFWSRSRTLWMNRCRRNSCSGCTWDWYRTMTSHWPPSGSPWNFHMALWIPERRITKMCLWITMPPVAKNSVKVILSIKVMVIMSVTSFTMEIAILKYLCIPYMNSLSLTVKNLRWNYWTYRYVNGTKQDTNNMILLNSSSHMK